MLESIIRFYLYSYSFKIIAEALMRGESFSENIEKFRDIYGDKLTTLIRVREETNSLNKMLAAQAVDVTSVFFVYFYLISFVYIK